jgi:hypothetical protein
MAVPNPTIAVVGGDASVLAFTWTLTTADNTGAGFEFVQWADVTWHFFGTWGGATAKVQGSADNTTFDATGLNSAAGGAEGSAAADKIYTTIERPRFMRPILTTVGVGATVVVTAICRRAQPMRT